MKIVAQISDPHVSLPQSLVERWFQASEALATALDHLNRMVPSPDVVVATGDLIDDGTEAEYERLRDIFSRLSLPLYLIPGNHDNREAMRAIFRDHTYLSDGPFVQYVVDLAPLRLVFVDTQAPGYPYGELCDTRLRWLETTLAAAPDTPTLLFMHHPPFKTGIWHMDEMGLKVGGEALGEIIQGAPQVERICCGHLHRPIQRRWYGTLAMTAPSVAHQVALRLGEGQGLSVVREPPACLLHVWSESVGLVSHTSYVGTFGAPQEVIPGRD